VVGDDAQAIYGFRAATIDNMLNFEHDFVPATRVALEENYRSTPDILSLANANIAHNLRRLDKRLFTQRAPYAKPWICRCQNQDMEASFVVSRVIELYRKGIRLSEMVVLFRANFVRARLEMALNQAGIPYMVTGALRFFEQEHIKDILAYLRIAQNPDDLISLHRVFLCYPALNDTLFLKLEEASDRYKAPFLRVCQQISQGAEQDSVSGPVAILHTFAKDMAALVNEAAVLEGPARLIEWTVDRLYKPILQRRAPAEWRERLEDIAVLRDIAIRYTNVGEFMEQITLNKIDIHPRVERPAYQPDDMLKLATVHAAKGKEWQAVFLIGLFEGAFPVRKSLAVPDGEEEERRLFHVAVTRAKEELYLTVPELLMGKTGPYTGIASRFVVELPGEAYQDILVE
jgi:DNA helicase-2/ATP-dependent DNA helicase PcrA